MSVLETVGGLLGGLGLFLLAVGMMTDGLKLAAGATLRKLLSDWSSTPIRGIFSGFTMTAIVQSSSAVTVASLGFVNAGLINMRQALGIVYGANIGTTITGWLVALVGFKLNINTFALPMIGIGMILKFTKPNSRYASIGIALVGFGLFFIGIDVLKTAFEGLVSAFDISQFTADGIAGIGIFLIVGIVMTILTQSSSAAIALTITAASSGMIGIYAAAAMVIGANVGTTSTAAFASIGATANAKRVASAQVLFNVATAIIALLVLPVLFFLISWITGLFQVEANAALSLALFHTVFNILGVLLVYPYNDRLADFLDQRFISREEAESKPRYLDKTISQTPALAVNALALELGDISQRIRVLTKEVLENDSPKIKEIEENIKVIRILSGEISKYIVQVECSALNQDTTNHLSSLMRIDQYFVSCTLELESISFLTSNHIPSKNLSSHSELENFLDSISKYVQLNEQSLRVSEEHLAEDYQHIYSMHDRVKDLLIADTNRAEISVSQLTESIDLLAKLLQFVQYYSKAMNRLRKIQEEITHIPSEAEIPPAPDGA